MTASTPPVPRWTRPLAAAALVGILVNAAVLVLAPFIRPDVDVMRDGLSHYAVGPGAALQEAGFVALGMTCAALGIALLRLDPVTRAAGALLVLASAGFVGLAVFPMGQGGPTTPIGDLHLTAGTLGAALQFAALLALLLRPGACATLGVSRRAGWGLAILAGTAAAAIQLAIWNPGWRLPEGALARLAVVPLLAWWAMVSLALLRERPQSAPAR